MQGDVSRDEDCKKIAAAAASWGGLDILVNNAGIFRGGPIAELSLEDIDATLAVNVRAVVVGSQAAACDHSNA